MPGLAAFGLGGFEDAQAEAALPGPVQAPPAYVDAIFVPDTSSIDVLTDAGVYVASINVSALTGSSCKGFAFSQNYSKLIVGAGSNLYWWSVVVVAPSTFTLTFEGVYAALGLAIAGVVQSQPAIGDFIVQSSTFLGNRAWYVDDDGNVDGPYSTGLTLNGWQVGPEMYVGYGTGSAPAVAKKAVNSGVEDPTIPDGGWETVFTYEGDEVGAFTGGASEVIDGRVYQAMVLDDVTYLAELSAGGTLTNQQVVADASIDLAIGGGVPMFARSYLHSARSYWFHNSIPTNIPKAYKSGNPISVGSQTAIQGITSNTPFRPHVYKYITGADEPGEEEPDFPGLEHDPSANTAPLWGPEFPAV